MNPTIFKFKLGYRYDSPIIMHFNDISIEIESADGCPGCDYSDGSTYSGQLKTDNRNGKGPSLTSTGSKCGVQQEAEFRDGYENGDLNVGEFENDLFNGKGAQHVRNFKEKISDESIVKEPGRSTPISSRESKSAAYTGEFRDGKSNGLGILKYENGDLYEGHFKDNSRHGHGVHIYSSGHIYTGEWKNDQRHGRCVLKYASGDIYEGEYAYDSRNGRGKFTYANSDVYEGEWKDHAKDGKGTFKYYCSGNTYEGGWKAGKKHGKGTFKCSDGSQYEGDFVNDKRHGLGVIRYLNGDTYNGHWMNDLREGRATFTFHDGSTFLGQFSNDTFQGPGSLTYAESGIVFDGNWDSGKKLTLGRLTYPNGETYIGECFDDKRHGDGALTRFEDIIEGRWILNNISGKASIRSNHDNAFYIGEVSSTLQREGMKTYSTADICQGNGTSADLYTDKGNWVDGLREGYGILTKRDGSIIYKGDWTLDTVEGNGTLRYTSGEVYEGEFNMELGTGTLRCTSGYTFAGQFEKGFRHDFAVLRLVTGDFCNKNDENTWNNVQSPERDCLALRLSCEWSLKGEWQNGVFLKSLNSQGGAAMSPGRMLDDINHVEL